MIQPELLTRLRLLADAYRLPVTSMAERVNEIAPPSAVQQVLAEVEARLADGRFRVNASGQTFDVLLPASTQPGERVQVSVPLLRSGNAAPVQAQPGQPEGSVDAQFSAAGKFIAQLAARSGGEPAPGAIGAALPLLPDAPIDTTLTAATLRELIALSGLFYESHQAEWVSGARDTGQLLREPQGQRSPLATGDARTPAPPQAPAEPEPASPSAARDATASQVPRAPIHPDTAPMVQQQLNTLEARHIVWTGQIWPGQAMRWEIEDSAPRSGQTDQPERSWQTRIALSLPRLGDVSALLTLAPSGLNVRLRADAPATDALFAEHAAELRTALAGAGFAATTIARNGGGGA